MTKPDSVPRELQDILRQYPESRVLELLLPDMNGIIRGKRVGRDEFSKVMTDGVNLPGATVLLDVQGRTFDCLDYGSGDGDPDVSCRPVGGSLVPVPWAYVPSLQVLAGMYALDGSPYFADPRHVLERVLERYHKQKLRPVVALELEFYLLEDEHSQIPTARRGRVPGTGMVQSGPQYASLDDLYEIDAFLAAVDKACKLQGIPAATAVVEFAPGQFEINLHHVDDPVLACDHAVLLRRVIKGVARSMGMAATFMAKPFAEHAGSGMHIHVSMLRQDGTNLFASGTSLDGQARAGDALRHAIGGLAQTMAQCMAIFAPNANSYRRLRKGFFVPLTPNWGFNHRNLALRVPLSDRENARLEHRVAGADANPYLVMAAVLAGIHHGMVSRIEPGPMVSQGELVEEVVTLPLRWEAALDAMAAADVLPDYLGREYCRVFEASRREEAERFHSQVSLKDYQWYLRAI